MSFSSEEWNYFWNIKTKEDRAELLETFSEVEIINYGNDLCPSVLVDGAWLVFLPNSFSHDTSDEKFTTYMVKHLDDYGSGEGTELESIGEVIRFLLSLR
jgi:hypothetical protein